MARPFWTSVSPKVTKTRYKFLYILVPIKYLLKHIFVSKLLNSSQNTTLYFYIHHHFCASLLWTSLLFSLYLWELTCHCKRDTSMFQFNRLLRPSQNMFSSRICLLNSQMVGLPSYLCCHWSVTREMLHEKSMEVSKT